MFLAPVFVIAGGDEFPEHPSPFRRARAGREGHNQKAVFLLITCPTNFRLEYEWWNMTKYSVIFIFRLVQFYTNLKEYDRIMAVFLLIMDPMNFRYVHNQNENFHYDHIPFNLKGTRKIFLWVYVMILKNFSLLWVNLTSIFYLSESIQSPALLFTYFKRWSNKKEKMHLSIPLDYLEKLVFSSLLARVLS